MLDRGEKWHAYQHIPSLEQYVLLSQAEQRAEVYSRGNGKWVYQRLTGDAKLSIVALQLELNLATLYANLPLGALEEDA